MTPAAELELVDQARTGDDAAFDALLRRRSPSRRRVADEIADPISRRRGRGSDYVRSNGHWALAEWSINHMAPGALFHRRSACPGWEFCYDGHRLARRQFAP